MKDALEEGPLAPEDRIFLLVYHRNGAEIAVLQPGRPVVIGREPPSSIVVADLNLSREHARFVLDEDKVLVEDLNSTNGTWIAGELVERGELRVGDEAIVGSVRVRVHAAAPAGPEVRGLDSHERFRVALEEEIVRARLFNHPFTVLMVRAPAPGVHVSSFAPHVRAQLRSADRTALYSAEVLEILCPEADTARGLEIARAIADRAADGGPLLVGVATFPEASTKAEDLVDLSRSAAHRATAGAPVQAAPAVIWPLDDAAPRSDEPIVGGKAIREVLDAAAKIARTSISVLIHGETGTGKEVVARAVHAASPRRAKQMIVINCGAIPEQLVESALFGHVKGSFSGAYQDQKGAFEAADGSTLFLDEIGELSAAAQVALLRVLDTNRVARVGTTREIAVDVRVIAATHRDLEAMCKAGTFRVDLYHRLDGETIEVPPLRTRLDEIEPLIERFVRQANQAHGSKVRGVRADTLALLKGYAWPGNVRELRNAILRAAAIAEGDRIQIDDLPERVRRAAGAAPSRGPGDSGAPREKAALESYKSFKARQKREEAYFIIAALKANKGNQTEAAAVLGMPLRTLADKIKKLGIRRGDFDAP